MERFGIQHSPNLCKDLRFTALMDEHSPNYDERLGVNWQVEKDLPLLVFNHSKLLVLQNQILRIIELTGADNTTVCFFVVQSTDAAVNRPSLAKE